MTDKKIGFAFDLHGTLVHSNEAWIKAFMLVAGSELIKEQVTRMVYGKVSRKSIATSFGVNYDEVLEHYHNCITPDYNICQLARVLSKYFPTFLVSSANQKKVERDLNSIGMVDLFTSIYHAGNFNKREQSDWSHLIVEHKLDLLYYIGNDIKEDVIGSNKICVLLSGTFMKSLDELGMLYNRDRETTI